MAISKTTKNAVITRAARVAHLSVLIGLAEFPLFDEGSKLYGRKFRLAHNPQGSSGQAPIPTLPVVLGSTWAETMESLEEIYAQQMQFLSANGIDPEWDEMERIELAALENGSINWRLWSDVKPWDMPKLPTFA